MEVDPENVPGSLYCIQVKDFLNLKELTIKPQQNLNILYGLNGSGKSAIISAIVLGLGGTPKTIGRGSKVSDFIRHTCETATIVVELWGDGTVHKIKRQFNQQCRSLWFLNNRQVAFNAIQESIINRYGIQVNNLCQFLPQDRVQDFAKMNSKQLLSSTLEAVGRGDLVVKLTNMKDSRSVIVSMEQQLKDLDSKLAQTQTDNEMLATKVKSALRKKKMLDDIEHIKRKMAWMQFELLKSDLELIKEEKKKATIILEKHRKALKPLLEKLDQIKQEVDECQKELKKMSAENASYKQKVGMGVDGLDTFRSAISKAKKDFSNMRLKKDQWLEEINTLQVRIEKQQNDQRVVLDNYGSTTEIDRKIREVENEINALRTETDEVNGKTLSVQGKINEEDAEIRRYQNQLRSLENVAAQRLRLLENIDRDAYKAVMWLRANKHEFEGNIYEPMILELNVTNEKYAKYFENCISNRDRVAFTCERTSDMMKLLNRLRVEQNLIVNVLLSDAEHPPLSSFVHPIPISQLESYGFFEYLDKLITGPDAIMKYLCRMYSIHTIPIGDATTYDKSANVPDQFQLFFSENHRFSVTRSRYSREKSTRISELHSDGTLSFALGSEKVKEVKLAIAKYEKIRLNHSNQLQAFNEELAKIDDKRKQSLDRRKELNTLRIQFSVIESRLQMLRKSLEHMQANPVDMEEAQKKLNESLSKCAVDLCSHVKETMEHSASNVSTSENCCVKAYQVSCGRAYVTFIVSQNAQNQQAVEDALKLVNRIAGAYDHKQQETKVALSAAKSLSKGCSPLDDGFLEFKDKYESLPDDMDALKAMQNTLESQLALLTTANDDELTAYHDAEKMIEKLQKTIRSNTSRLDNLQKNLQEQHNSWLAPLFDIISEINNNFKNAFAKINCHGMLEISRTEDAFDYDSYGILIKVSFRDSQLMQPLNPYIQSGGERAITTAFYMLSLQELTQVPFRCVDEINQGMDAANEERLYEYLLSLYKSGKKIQYFMVTPKLSRKLKLVEPGVASHLVLSCKHNRK